MSNKPAISIDDGLTAAQQLDLLKQVAPVATNARNGMPLLVEEYERAEKIEVEQVILRKTARNRKAYDTRNAGSLSFCFECLRSPNVQAKLRKSYRESKRIMYADCLLCDNNACHGIMHYKVLPLNAFADGCTILRCQRDIATLENTINKQKEQIKQLSALGRESNYYERKQIMQQIRSIDEQIAPTKRKIRQLQTKLEDKQLSLLDIELKINGILK